MGLKKKEAKLYWYIIKRAVRAKNAVEALSKEKESYIMGVEETSEVKEEKENKNEVGFKKQ